jgi:two-component system chemotaxis sensor kinase CheA
LDAVSETTKISAAKINEINHRKATTLRGDVLGLVDLGEILDLKVSEEGRDLLPVVIVNINDRRLGLVVDQLLQRQDVVIKSMGDYLGDIQAFPARPSWVTAVSS